MAICGKHRGVVTNNVDPEQIGRIQVSVPGILEGEAFALPSVPYAGPSVGFFAIPPVGANVWVEFESGDVNTPIWSGCFWNAGEVPANPATPEMKVWKTEGVTLTINDTPGTGGLILEVGPPLVSTPLRMVFDANGIELSNGTQNIKLTVAGISVNDGALEVV